MLNQGSGADVFRLPATRHIPGTGSKPDKHYLEQIISLVPDKTQANLWQDNVPYRYGWWLFQHSYFWEAHEVWEAVWWRATPQSLERHFMQGIIQLSNASLKHKQNHYRACNRIVSAALELLGEGRFKSAFMGVDVRAICTLLCSMISSDAL